MAERKRARTKAGKFIPDDPNNSIYNSVNANIAIVQRDGTTKADCNEVYQHI